MRGYDPSDGCCDGDATLIECRDCGEVYDADEAGEDGHVCASDDPDRIPTTPDGVPVTNAELVYGDVLPYTDGEILEGAGQ